MRLEADADLAKACYNTLGAIALQGVRQADMRLGETCAVIGLGLIGQLACLELRASGVNVVGIDVSAAAVKTASEHCADLALTRNDPGIKEKILDYTDGRGVDAVLIAAATSSLDPVNFAGAICRRKGRVVVLGAVPTGFDRDPYYYKKNWNCACPARMVPAATTSITRKRHRLPGSLRALDRKRNMQAFQQLVHSGRIDLQYLTTHVFKFEDAPKAYDIVLTHSEPFLGIVLEYDTTKEHTERSIVTDAAAAAIKSDAPGIAFIGAGSYAQGNLLPNLPAAERAPRIAVMTNSGTTSKRVAENSTSAAQLPTSTTSSATAPSIPYSSPHATTPMPRMSHKPSPQAKTCTSRNLCA